MKLLQQSKCSRCGSSFSITGVSKVIAIQIAKAHVCVDGVHHESGEPTLQVVLGPGERLYDYMKPHHGLR